MSGRRLELNGQTMPVVELIGSHMPGGFFLYQAEAPERLLYANKAVFDIFGCDGLEDFTALTGYTFKGMLHPDDYEAVSGSIVEQIQDSDDQMDYVEYRIVRKDGSVRWVDDYGHYTETEAYGGIYYVFISDITEKRAAREQDDAVRDAVIRTLTDSYNTVWLINDVETENCSLYHGDLGRGSVHAEAIRNALSHPRYTDTKIQYVDTMVAEEDRARMQEELSLPYIVRQLSERSQFSVTFLRALEDGPRYYRIDIARVRMPSGSMGVMMGFKDVDDDVREEQTVQEALREGKRAEEENRRLVEEVESAAKLAQLMGSVATLLTNMPAMSFSKDAATGKYLACNQSFAGYAHKASPAEVIGRTDHELFDPVTADHFVEDDRKALSMDDPYIFFEDVPDAAGHPKSFQTTKIKFTDGSGRLCTLGMCVDVTEMTRIKSAEAEARVKQQELERRIALQEKLLEEERQRTQQERLITALSSDYWGVYYIELDKDEGVCYQVHSALDDGFQVGERFSFLQDISAYADRFVAERYRAGFRSFIQPSSIREGLRAARVISYRYLVVRGGRETYEMIRFAGVRHPEDRDDHVVHAVSMCFMDVDLEMRKTLEQSQALSAALAAAEDANRAKSAFLSNMSHEIRTPITGILGMNEMIQRESRNEEVLRYSDNIRKAGVSLLGIISDILDFSKIEAGRMEVASVEYRLASLLKDSLDLVRLRAEEKGLTLKAEVDPALPAYLRGDELRVKQILTNLLMNAVKYTEKGSILLEVRLARIEGDTVELLASVTDTGIGIKEEEMGHLFSAFDRLDAEKTRHIEGTGLGLAIISRLLSLMGSELEVESVYSQGSRFWFHLRQGIASPDPIGPFDPLAVPAPQEGRERSRTPFTAPEARILLVDDTPMNLQVIAGLLRRTEMRIDTAESGEECIRLFGAEEYDLVFLDYRMPHMDGIETLEELQRRYPEKVRRTPILCLTASAVSGDREKMLSAGFTEYLTKPVDIDEMEEALIRRLPPEKVHRTAPVWWPQERAPGSLPPGLARIEALDPAMGVRSCGSEKGYLDALRTYTGSIEARASGIERDLEAMDLASYTIAVHSLKSISLTIGAVAVAALARDLERAGNEGDAETIRRETPLLLEKYRGLRAPLSAALEEAAEKEDAVDRPGVSDGELEEALRSIRALSETFDQGSICMVMDLVEEHGIPEARRGIWRELRDAVDLCDWDAVEEVLGKSGV